MKKLTPRKKNGLKKTTKSASRRSPSSRRATAAVIELVPAKLKLSSILVPIDFSAESKKALRYAVPFAEQFGAKLTLLHVVEPVATPDFVTFPLMMENDRIVATCRAKLATVARQQKLDPKLVEKTLVRLGQPFHEITEAARTLKVDVIVISTHGYTGLKHALMGSTAERVVRHAPCPVLVVREKEKEFI
ncbi:MAG: universal stress protein [Verrucomicrobia bacterium]|nr:universal stress protein [Verrucomicrobiota bacterium]